MIFLDVGAHDGQTLEEVTKPTYRFDHVHAFEPMPTQFGHLVERFGDAPNVSLHNYGLLDGPASLPVYGSNDGMEASVYATKRDVDATIVTECAFRSASSFFLACVPEPSTAIVKLNCEGAEIRILNDLIDSGEIWKVAHALIDFDIRKVAGSEDEEAVVLERLARIGFDRFVTEFPSGATHQDRIANWLAAVPMTDRVGS